MQIECGHSTAEMFIVAYIRLVLSIQRLQFVCYALLSRVQWKHLITLDMICMSPYPRWHITLHISINKTWHLYGLKHLTWFGLKMNRIQKTRKWRVRKNKTIFFHLKVSDSSLLKYWPLCCFMEKPIKPFIRTKQLCTKACQKWHFNEGKDEGVIIKREVTWKK